MIYKIQIQIISFSYFFCALLFPLKPGLTVGAGYQCAFPSAKQAIKYFIEAADGLHFQTKTGQIQALTVEMRNIHFTKA